MCYQQAIELENVEVIFRWGLLSAFYTNLIYCGHGKLSVNSQHNKPVYNRPNLKDGNTNFTQEI